MNRLFLGSIITVCSWMTIPLILLKNYGNFILFFGFGIWLIILILMFAWGNKTFPMEATK